MRAADGVAIAGVVAAAAPYENMSKGFWLGDDMRSFKGASFMRSAEFQVGTQWRLSSYPGGTSDYYHLYLLYDIGISSDGEGGRVKRKFRSMAVLLWF